jgi:aminodeoxyfutalosine synthase
METLSSRTIPDAELRARIASGSRLTAEEALFLLQRWPLHDLGALAFQRKRQRHGDVITYIVNKQVNPTNLCVHACKFCDFAAKPNDPHAYSLEEDDILASLNDPELTEVHIVGGLWKTWNLDRSLTSGSRPSPPSKSISSPGAPNLTGPPCSPPSAKPG